MTLDTLVRDYGSRLERLCARVAGEVGSACWVELYTKDTKRAGSFYTQLFGWRAKMYDLTSRTTLSSVAIASSIRFFVASGSRSARDMAPCNDNPTE